MKVHWRNAHISIAIGSTILLAGAYFFHDSEGPLLIVVLVALFATFWTVASLNERDERRRKHDQ
jgi:VIT1/CCC1 family predicted Fe2+/Mn2+ transporter